MVNPAHHSFVDQHPAAQFANALGEQRRGDAGEREMLDYWWINYWRHNVVSVEYSRIFINPGKEFFSPVWVCFNLRICCSYHSNRLLCCFMICLINDNNCITIHT